MTKYNLGLIHKIYTLLDKTKQLHLNHTKIRSEVSGGGRKPWKQKGTGKARAGSIRSPLWKNGGITFGPRFHITNYKINKKEHKKSIYLFLNLIKPKLISFDENLFIKNNTFLLDLFNIQFNLKKEKIQNFLILCNSMLLPTARVISLSKCSLNFLVNTKVIFCSNTILNSLHLF